MHYMLCTSSAENRVLFLAYHYTNLHSEGIISGECCSAQRGQARGSVPTRCSPFCPSTHSEGIISGERCRTQRGQARGSVPTRTMIPMICSTFCSSMIGAFRHGVRYILSFCRQLQIFKTNRPFICGRLVTKNSIRRNNSTNATTFISG